MNVSDEPRRETFVRLPADVQRPFQVFLNGVEQREGVDFVVRDGDARVRARARAGEGRGRALDVDGARDRRLVRQGRRGRRRLRARRPAAVPQSSSGRLRRH